MGSESQIKSVGCDFDPVEIVGIWFLVYLSCNRKVLVNRRHLKMLDGEVGLKSWRGSCRETLRMIAPFDSKNRDVEGLLCSFIVCDG